MRAVAPSTGNTLFFSSRYIARGRPGRLELCPFAGKRRIERRVWQVGELPDGDVTSAHRLEPGVRAWLWVLLGVLAAAAGGLSDPAVAARLRSQDRVPPEYARAWSDLLCRLRGGGGDGWR